MKEQVKEWIVDKSLTTDSFDSIMIGVIYNSGHSTLDDPDVRKWIETHPSEFRGMLLPNLTDDQQVVLEWLKRKRTVNKFEPLQAIVWMLGATEIYSDSELGRAYYNLTDKEEFQVLAAFAEWGIAGD